MQIWGKFRFTLQIDARAPLIYNHPARGQAGTI